MTFVVTRTDGTVVSRHRKWQRAIDSAVKHADRFRGLPKYDAYEVRHLERRDNKKTERLFSTSQIHNDLTINSEYVRTTFTEYSKTIRYEITQPVDRIPHN